jgi:NAD(P)-dependent dehydrogenase (short-subunit alcohol dehydrogenase family)
MSGRVAGKSIVVTGGAQGIGRGCAEMLAAEGALVTLGDLRGDDAEAVCAGIREGGAEAIAVETDVTSEEQCAALIERAVTHYGRLDGLLNNVGWFPRSTIEETTAEFWHQVLAVNLDSVFYCCKHAIPRLREAGGGSIVNMGSVHGIQGIATLPHYSAAKGGVLSLTRTLAGAYARDGIRANYVIPGWVLTDTEIALQASHGRSQEDLEAIGRTLPLGRHQTPQDVAYAVLYLLSDESSQVSGTLMSIDAGISTLPNGHGASTPYNV